MPLPPRHVAQGHPPNVRHLCCRSRRCPRTTTLPRMGKVGSVGAVVCGSGVVEKAIPDAVSARVCAAHRQSRSFPTARLWIAGGDDPAGSTSMATCRLVEVTPGP